MANLKKLLKDKNLFIRNFTNNKDIRQIFPHPAVRLREAKRLWQLVPSIQKMLKQPNLCLTKS